MALEGIYRSRLKEWPHFMWAFQIDSEECPAHFGSKTIFEVIEYFVDPMKIWAYAEEDKKYLILQKDMIKWKDQ